MALSESNIDATDSGATANSYDTLANANTYFEQRPDSGTWKDANEGQRVGVMLFSVILIEREVYYARQSTTDQALQFPRTGQAAVPPKVKQAQFEQALDLLKGDWVKREEFRELQAVGMSSVATRETMARMNAATPEGYPAYSLCRAARELILPFMETTVILGRA